MKLDVVSCQRSEGVPTQRRPSKNANGVLAVFALMNMIALLLGGIALVTSTRLSALALAEPTQLIAAPVPLELTQPPLDALLPHGPSGDVQKQYWTISHESRTPLPLKSAAPAWMSQKSHVKF
jgi:hypothetical protein